MMEGLVGCPRTPTSLPRPLDADTAPSVLMSGSKVAGEGHFENLRMASLKVTTRHTQGSARWLCCPWRPPTCWEGSG